MPTITTKVTRETLMEWGGHTFTLPVGPSSTASDVTITATGEVITATWLDADDDCADPLEDIEGVNVVKFRAEWQLSAWAARRTETDDDDCDPADWSGVDDTSPEFHRYEWGWSARMKGADYLGSWYGLEIPAEGHASPFTDPEQAGKAIQAEWDRWADGESYGVYVMRVDMATGEVADETCWGFIGYEYAVSEAEAHH